MGLWRPVPARPRQQLVDFYTVAAPKIILLGPPELSVEAARLAVDLKVTDGIGDLVRDFLRGEGITGAVKAAALSALAEMKDPRFSKDLLEALGSRDGDLLREAARLVPAAKLENGAKLLETLASGKGPAGGRQSAIVALGTMGADDALLRLLAAGLPADSRLDWIEAASKRPALKEKAAAFQASLAPGADALEGGDPAAGRRIFFDRTDVQCVRCHQVGDQGGQVGPPLTKIGEQKTREYLLESILTPNKQIAEGWGQTALQLQDDSVEVGRIEKETDAGLTLLLPDGRRRTIAKGDLKARKAALSSMPEDLAKQLSRRDLRDLVEFLAGLK
jgi:quinoprotein glucose dehydrogenase